MSWWIAGAALYLALLALIWAFIRAATRCDEDFDHD